MFKQLKKIATGSRYDYLNVSCQCLSLGRGEEFQEQARDSGIVGIGETGLDSQTKTA